MRDLSKHQDIRAIISIDFNQSSVSTITMSVNDLFQIEDSITSETGSLETIPEDEEIKVIGVIEIEI